MKKYILSIAVLMFLSGCQNVQVKTDISRTYCPSHGHSVATDFTIKFGNGQYIYIPLACLK